MKIYGNTKTNLVLSSEAKKVYNDSDPITIKEIETDDGYRYNISGIIEAENLTEAEVNAMLESFGSEID